MLGLMDFDITGTHVLLFENSVLFISKLTKYLEKLCSDDLSFFSVATLQAEPGDF